MILLSVIAKRHPHLACHRCQGVSRQLERGGVELDLFKHGTAAGVQRRRHLRIQVAVLGLVATEPATLVELKVLAGEITSAERALNSLICQLAAKCAIDQAGDSPDNSTANRAKEGARNRRTDVADVVEGVASSNAVAIADESVEPFADGVAGEGIAGHAEHIAQGRIALHEVADASQRVAAAGGEVIAQADVAATKRRADGGAVHEVHAGGQKVREPTAKPAARGRVGRARESKRSRDARHASHHRLHQDAQHGGLEGVLDSVPEGLEEVAARLKGAEQAVRQALVDLVGELCPLVCHRPGVVNACADGLTIHHGGPDLLGILLIGIAAFFQAELLQRQQRVADLALGVAHAELVSLALNRSHHVVGRGQRLVNRGLLVLVGFDGRKIPACQFLKPLLFLISGLFHGRLLCQQPLHRLGVLIGA